MLWLYSLDPCIYSETCIAIGGLLGQAGLHRDGQTNMREGHVPSRTLPCCIMPTDRAYLRRSSVAVLRTWRLEKKKPSIFSLPVRLDSLILMLQSSIDEAGRWGRRPGGGLPPHPARDYGQGRGKPSIWTRFPAMRIFSYDRRDQHRRVSEAYSGTVPSASLLTRFSWPSLIAIMLGRLRMSTEEALQEYDRCVRKVFSFGNRKWTTATEMFRATALKEVVEDLVRRRNMGEYRHDHTLLPDSTGQCFVCAMPVSRVGDPCLLRSFTCSNLDGIPSLKICEAARATTATSFFFKPMPLKIRLGPRRGLH